MVLGDTPQSVGSPAPLPQGRSATSHCVHVFLASLTHILGGRDVKQSCDEKEGAGKAHNPAARLNDLWGLVHGGGGVQRGIQHKTTTWRDAPEKSVLGA